MAVLVTGSTGFIGSRLVERLVQKGEAVTVLLREGKSSNPKTSRIVGDLSYPDFDFSGDSYETVYHLAALWPGEKDKKLQRRVNYDGTVNLFSKVKDRTKSFVYVSGLGVFGNTREKTIDETTPLRPDTDYARIRLEAQQFLEDNCRQHGISFKVAYLGDVYGNGGWFKSMMVERLRRHSFRILGSGKYYRSFVHVDDVVSALVSIGSLDVPTDSFVVTDSNPVMFSEFVNFLCQKIGTDEPKSIPAFLAKPALGSDFITLLTTSTRAANSKLSKICPIAFPSYKDGVISVVSEMMS